MQQGTVLAGQDGVSPAINAQTGQQITIEDLLRQRGLMAAGGKMSIFPQVPMEGTPIVEQPASAATNTGSDVLAQAMSAIGRPTDASGGIVSTAPAVDPITGKPSVSDGVTSADSEFGLGDAALVAGGAAGTYALYRALRNRNSNSGVNNPNFGANTGPAPVPGQGANQSSPSAVTRVRTMQPTTISGRGTANGGTLVPKQSMLPASPAAPTAAAQALTARQNPSANLPAVVGQQVPEDEGLRATVGRSAKPSAKDALKKRAIKRIRPR